MDSVDPIPLFSNASASTLPRASLTTLIVRDSRSWPSVLLPFVEPLNGTGGESVDRSSATISPDGQHPALLSCWRRIEAQINSERQLPHLGPDSHHRVLGLGLGDLLAQVVPGSNVHFMTSFLPCVFSGHSHNVDIHTLPQRETVTALLTLPIDLLGVTASESEEESESNDNESSRLSDMQDDLDDEGSASAVSTLSSYQRSSQQFSSGSSELVYGSESSSLVPSTSSDTFSEAHLLLPRYPSDCIPVAAFCIATYDEVYGIVASALMQRHTLGIDAPLLSLAFSPDTWKVQLVIGWPSSRTNHDCVDLHIAHAPLTQGEDHGLGVFDVSNFASLHALVNFLVAHAPALATPVANAQELIRSQSPPERPVLRADGAAVGSARLDFRTRIEAWLRGFSSSDLPDTLSQEERPREHAQVNTSGLDLKDLKDERDKILQDIASPDECSVLVFYPEYRQGRRMTSEKSYPAPADVTVFEALVENNVVLHAWPTPDFPDDLSGINMTKMICEDYVYAYKFPESIDSDASVGLSSQNSQAWDDYTHAVAEDDRLRDAAGIPPVRVTAASRLDILRILPEVVRICENAQRDVHPTGSRQNWDALLQLCLQDATNVALPFSHIRSDRSIPFPRNAYCDATHKNPWSFTRQEPLTRPFRENFYGLRWCPPKVSLSTGPAWLRRARAELQETIAEELSSRVNCAGDWMIRQVEEKSLYGGLLINLRVLDSAAEASCDTVAFLSISDVFCVDRADKESVRLIAEFSIIGRYTPNRPSRHSFTWNDAGNARALNATYPSSQEDENMTSSDDYAESYNELPLPLLWLEDSMVHGSFDDAFNQSRYRILSSGRFLAALGIYDLPIFAIATAGSKAHLLCGWATKSAPNPEPCDVLVHIADINCPVWDLQDTNEAIKFCAFLLRLRHLHARRLREAFDACREEFTHAWQCDPTTRRFQWTLQHQQRDALLKDLYVKRKTQEDKSRYWRPRIHEVEELMEALEVPAAAESSVLARV
ncbi:uncharacterized protein SCHCODRAFT_02748236 [Schizophyllum commune H4-8]|uniref:uncharacterized protein n=1 Tax=Schizophyllum commune (strain H4-8 / FGSC 9210) TaxID=578458 RepID=UPI00215F7D5A|nr:uncharacterized protein SCHCODRAFT_02748236 [Schizophyllum commune H4-8]KAI5894414.1 hypothetical protein SCHCODRAFT_02748236 [Schizophyllum commune H4-8]